MGLRVLGFSGFTRAESMALRLLSYLLIVAAVLGVGWSASVSDYISLLTAL